MSDKIRKTEAEWREILSPQAYNVLRQKGTERAFTGQYDNLHDDGIYRCGACGEPLFSSETKYDSGSGWPSFYAPLSESSVDTETDRRLFMTRTEVTCSRCGSHLGHVFDDGPKPTGMRYCLNSVSLDFVPAGSTQDDED
jgi:peptide-methionine (R)-S-oxide reductase